MGRRGDDGRRDSGRERSERTRARRAGKPPRRALPRESTCRVDEARISALARDDAIRGNPRRGEHQAHPARSVDRSGLRALRVDPNPRREQATGANLADLETLFTNGRDFAVASHDGRMIERAVALAKVHPTPFEFAMLQGVRDPLKIELVKSGHRVAEYIPYGPNWLPYFTRRLRERPRNVITMIRSFVSG